MYICINSSKVGTIVYLLMLSVSTSLFLPPVISFLQSSHRTFLLISELSAEMPHNGSFLPLSPLIDSLLPPPSHDYIILLSSYTYCIWQYLLAIPCLLCVLKPKLSRRTGTLSSMLTLYPTWNTDSHFFREVTSDAALLQLLRTLEPLLLGSWAVPLIHLFLVCSNYNFASR